MSKKERAFCELFVLSGALAAWNAFALMDGIVVLIVGLIALSVLCGDGRNRTK